MGGIFEVVWIYQHLKNIMRDLCELGKSYYVMTGITIIEFNSSPLSIAYMRQWIKSTLAQIMACRLDGTKSLSERMLSYCLFDP